MTTPPPTPGVYLGTTDYRVTNALVWNQTPPPCPGVYLVKTTHGTFVYAPWDGKEWPEVGFLEHPAWSKDPLRTRPKVVGWTDPQRDVGIEPEGTHE